MIVRGMRKPESGLAFDRESVRTLDKDGRLHVAVSNITKATVNGYAGNEIPDWEALGLAPNRIYYLLRDPAELEKAAPTFNNLPILRDHVPVSAEAPMQELVIGSTGTDTAWSNPYLCNSAVIWCQEDIDDIEAERKKEWSCAYHYRAEMTPGSYLGLRYDGIMRDIVGNHVALVDEGRAGPDVVVGDNLPGAVKMLKSRRALMLSGAIAALVAPKLAQGKTLALDSALAGYSAKTKGDRDKLAGKIVTAVKPLLAQDGEVDVADVVAIIAAVEGAEDVPEAADEITEAAPPPPAGKAPTAADDDGDALERVMAFLADKLGDEDMAAVKAIVSGEPAAEDEEPDDDKGKPKPAMDAAAISRRVGRTVAEMREAERAVEPHIGAVTIAQDSAAAIYRLALDHAKVDLTGVHPSAFKSMVAMLPKPGDAKATIALDHAGVANDFRSRFPTAGQLVAN